VISHGHQDHLGGLAYWASQRLLNAMGPGTVLAPEEIASSVEELLRLTARLEGGKPYPISVIPVHPGTSVALRKDVEIRFFTTDHWVPTLGSSLVWQRRRLRDEYAGLPTERIAELKRDGVEITETIDVVLLSYCADTGSSLFSTRPETLDCEVLLVECSFYRDSDRARAEEYGHMHIDDVEEVLGRFNGRHVVLMHPSRRNRLREIEDTIDNRLRPCCQANLDHLMVDWD
jgi:ribonuclease Z